MLMNPGCSSSLTSSDHLTPDTDLHGSGDSLSVTQDLVKVLGSQNVPQSGL